MHRHESHQFFVRNRVQLHEIEHSLPRVVGLLQCVEGKPPEMHCVLWAVDSLAKFNLLPMSHGRPHETVFLGPQAWGI